MVKQPSKMAEAEWYAFGERLFGKDHSNWRFKCPTCGNVMSLSQARSLLSNDLEKLRKLEWSVEQECIGRYLENQGCDWAAYGLFSGPHFVNRPSGSLTPVLGFDIPG